MDLRIDKDFAINFKKKADGVDVHDARRNGGLFFNIYFRIENVLNTRDVLGVYGFSGSSTNDGYLTSPRGIQDITNRASSASFVDLYNIAQLNPNLYNRPRRATVGLQINF